MAKSMSIHFLLLSWLAITAFADHPETLSSAHVGPGNSATNTVNQSSAQENTPRSNDGKYIFVPERDWKPILAGQAIPPGLHVRMNLQTGLNEARLMPPSDDSAGDSAVVAVQSEADSASGNVENSNGIKVQLEEGTFLRKDLEEMLKKIDKGEDVFAGDEEQSEEEKVKVKQKFRSLEELKQDFAEMNLQIKTDREILKGLIAKYNAKNSAVMEEAEEKLIFLQDMEYYVHQIDNARDFLEMGGVELLKIALNDSSPTLRTESAHVLGSAAQNNPPVQILLLEQGFLEILLGILGRLAVLPVDPSSSTLLSRHIYALSAGIRNFPVAQNKFLELNGARILESLLMKEGLDRAPQQKVIALMADLVAERHNTREALLHSDPLLDKSSLEARQRQYGETLEVAIGRYWPGILTDHLSARDHVTSRDILQIFSHLHADIAEIPEAEEKVLNLLVHFTAEAAAYGERENEDSYFLQLAALCRTVLDGCSLDDFECLIQSTSWSGIAAEF